MNEHLKMDITAQKAISVSKGDKILKGFIELPASKSISNRALIIQFLAKSQINIKKLSAAHDTVLMNGLLKTVPQNLHNTSPVIIDGQDAGTVIRFLTALLSILPGNWVLTGTKRMQERPIGILVDSLKELGAEIQYLEKHGYPPLSIKGKNLPGGKVQVDGSVSSQFLTALIMIAPTLQNGLQIIIRNKISSAPYIQMTLNLLSHFGVRHNFEENCLKVPHQGFQAGEITIESDWTSAAYWYEMAAIAKKADLILNGLSKESIQGDAELPEIYKSFGVETEFLESGIRLTKSKKVVDHFEYDFSNCPDLAQSVIVTCAALGIQGTFSGIESLRIKETDRVLALQTELNKLGVKAKVRGSEFEVRSSPQSNIINLKSKIINTYADHRMAMAFAPLALVFGSIQIENPDVVSKSYPGFWNELTKVGFIIKQ